MVFKNLSFLKAFSGLITKSNSQNNIRITKHKAKRVKNSYKRSSNIVEAFKKKSETEIELIADFRLPDLIIRMDSMIKRLKSNNVEILEGDSQPPKESPSNRNKQWLKTVPNTNPKFSALENSILLPDEHTPDWNHPRISASEEHGISYPEFGNNFGWHIRNSKVWCEELLDISLSLKLYLALKKLSNLKSNENVEDSDLAESNEQDINNINCYESINLQVLCLPKQVLILKRELAKLYESNSFSVSTQSPISPPVTSHVSSKTKMELKYSHDDREVVLVRILKDLRAITVILLDSILCYLQEVANIVDKPIKG